MWHYTRLNNSLLSLLNDSDLYLISGILNGEQIKILESLQISCECIIENSNDYTIDTLIDYKSNLFKELTDMLCTLNFNMNEELKYSEFEEQNNK